MRDIKHISGILVALALLTIASCKRPAWDPSMKQNEVIALYQQVLTTANEESPERALLMADSLRQAGAVPDYHADLMRAKIYAQSPDYLWLGWLPSSTSAHRPPRLKAAMRRASG